jgi:hypothetical protein
VAEAPVSLHQAYSLGDSQKAGHPLAIALGNRLCSFQPCSPSLHTACPLGDTRPQRARCVFLFHPGECRLGTYLIVNLALTLSDRRDPPSTTSFLAQEMAPLISHSPSIPRSTSLRSSRTGSRTNHGTRRVPRSTPSIPVMEINPTRFQARKFLPPVISLIHKS